MTSRTTEPAAAKAVRASSEPGWAPPLRAAVRDLVEIEERAKRTHERLAALADEERVTRRAHEDAEIAVEHDRSADADLAAAKHRAETAEAERAKAERLLAGIAAMIEGRRDALRPLQAKAGPGLDGWLTARMDEHSREFGAAIQTAAAVAAKALALADAAGAMHLAAPILRLALPAGLLAVDPRDVIRLGHEPGKLAPEPSPASEVAERLAMLVRSAERAVAPAEGDREAA